MIKPQNVFWEFDDFCNDCKMAELDNDITYNNNIPIYHIKCIHRNVCRNVIDFYKSKMKEKQ